MKTIACLSALLVCAPIIASARDLVVSDWVTFPEAQVRLIAERPGGGNRLNAGIEIRLAEGYKTYWRTPGDSGVPPVFDFAPSSGVKAVEVQFPFPNRFDDGAGGTSWGYKNDVILPIALTVAGSGVTLAMKLDFAVCGALCIPLNAEFSLDPATGPRADDETVRALDANIAALPAQAGGDAAVLREKGASAFTWRVRVPYSGDPGRLSAFAEAEGYIDVVRVLPGGEGFAEFVLRGEAAAGSGGRFGPVRLTYGENGKAFERMIDLDGAAQAH